MSAFDPEVAARLVEDYPKPDDVMEFDDFAEEAGLFLKLMAKQLKSALEALAARADERDGLRAEIDRQDREIEELQAAATFVRAELTVCRADRTYFRDQAEELSAEVDWLKSLVTDQAPAAGLSTVEPDQSMLTLLVTEHDGGDEATDDGPCEQDPLDGGCGVCRTCDPEWWHLRDKFAPRGTFGVARGSEILDDPERSLARAEQSAALRDACATWLAHYELAHLRFRHLVANALEAGMTRETLCTEFEVSDSVVNSWITGSTRPHLALKIQVVQFICAWAGCEHRDASAGALCGSFNSYTTEVCRRCRMWRMTGRVDGPRGPSLPWRPASEYAGATALLEDA